MLSIKTEFISSISTVGLVIEMIPLLAPLQLVLSTDADNISGCVIVWLPKTITQAI
jgi:hypothetical protein